MKSPNAKSKVQVWIYRRGAQGIQVLFLKLIDERGGFWQPVTGGVESGEGLLEAARREAFEETHLSFKGAPLPLEYSIRYPSRWGGEVEEVAFILEADPSAEVVWDSSEHVGFSWVDVGAPEWTKWVDLLRYPSVQRGLEKVVETLRANQVGVENQP